MSTLDPTAGATLPPGPSARPPNKEGDAQDFGRWVRHECETAASSPAGRDGVPPGEAADTAALVALPVDGVTGPGVLHGWLARAHYGLSNLARGLEAAGRPPMAPDPGNPADGRPVRAGRTAGPSALSVTGAGDQGNGGSPLRAGTGRLVADALTSASRAAATADTSARLMWPDRSLRRVVGADGEVTIWLRDYRMDAQQVADAIDAILAERPGPAPPNRIVINGVEVWRQPLSTQSERP